MWLCVCVSVCVCVNAWRPNPPPQTHTHTHTVAECNWCSTSMMLQPVEASWDNNADHSGYFGVSWYFLWLFGFRIHRLLDELEHASGMRYRHVRATGTADPGTQNDVFSKGLCLLPQSFYSSFLLRIWMNYFSIMILKRWARSWPWLELDEQAVQFLVQGVQGIALLLHWFILQYGNNWKHDGRMQMLSKRVHSLMLFDQWNLSNLTNSG